MTQLARNIAISLCLSPLAATGQDQASTLARLSDRSSIIAHVQVVAINRDDRGQTQVVLRRVEDLKGKSPAIINLTEPGARACGRALWGLIPGAGHVAFLDAGAGKPSLSVSSARSLPALEPDLLTHLKALITADSSAARVGLLAEGLFSSSARVREDSALGLPLEPELWRADARARARISNSLRDCLADEDRRLLSLMLVVGRLGLEESLPDLLDAYLDNEHAGFDRAFERLLPNFAADVLVPAMEQRYRQQNSLAGRLLPILDRLHADAAAPLLRQMLEDSNRQVALGAGTCLLEQGLGKDELVEILGEEDAASCAARMQARRPTFRAILRARIADEVDRK